MRVLQIGSDRSKRGDLVRGSIGGKRQEAYARALGSIDDISFSLRSDGFTSYKSGALSVNPTNSLVRLFYGIDAIRIARRLPRPDVVSAQDPFEAGLVGAVIARLLRVPLHVQVHTDFLSREYGRHSLLNRIRVAIAPFVLRRAARVRVVSERIKKSIAGRYHPRAPISVLPMFVDIQYMRSISPDFSLVKRFQAFAARLLTVARLEPEKNVALAIEAFSKSAPNDACLIIVGEGSERASLEKLARSLGIFGRIFFEGERSAAAYYALADIVLVPSRYEGYGVVIVEARAAGLPVLSTDVGVAREAGAIVASPKEFSAALANWFKKRLRAEEPVDYPYATFEEYVRTYSEDLMSAVSGSAVDTRERSAKTRDEGAAERTGLAFHPATPAFLERAYALRLEGWEAGMPLYRDSSGKLFLGGWGSFYTVCRGDPENVRRDAEMMGAKYGLVEGCFSLSKDLFRARHVNIIIDIPEGMSPGDRLRMYERNIQKHIRNTVAKSPLRYEMGSPPRAWYKLYRRGMTQHGTRAYSREWFEALGSSFGNDAIVSAAYDGEKLVGALYCLRFERYMLLFSISTNPMYRQERIDSGLYDRAIVYAIENGVRVVDFGLTGARAASLLAFKRGFGGKPWYIATRTFGHAGPRLLDFARRLARALLRRFSKR